MTTTSTSTRTDAAVIHSVNIGSRQDSEHTSGDGTGIDKRPVDHAVQVSAPGLKGVAGSGLAGDAVCDLRHHGGDDQAVYAYALEDLTAWSAELGRELPPGIFGENLTTLGIDLAAARPGERWAVGDSLVLEVSDPRIPCRTFAGHLGEKSWVKRFTERGLSGTYLRVVTPGPVRAGDRLVVISRPDHEVTVGKAFRAFTTEPALLAEMVSVPGLSAGSRAVAARRSKVSTPAAG
ncbi:MOSC domain-containing protein [Nakamurella silvestris]|nr:MOSC domain-containing protein [Nakamurella silvestris]